MHPWTWPNEPRRAYARTASREQCFPKHWIFGREDFGVDRLIERSTTTAACATLRRQLPLRNAHLPKSGAPDLLPPVPPQVRARESRECDWLSLRPGPLPRAAAALSRRSTQRETQAECHGLQSQPSLEVTHARPNARTDRSARMRSVAPLLMGSSRRRLPITRRERAIAALYGSGPVTSMGGGRDRTALPRMGRGERCLAFIARSASSGYSQRRQARRRPLSARRAQLGESQGSRLLAVRDGARGRDQPAAREAVRVNTPAFGERGGTPTPGSPASSFYVNVTVIVGLPNSATSFGLLQGPSVA